MELEIWSDIACPWCYIGKRRMERAVQEFEHADELTVTWRSFELDPEAPADRGGELAAHVARKFGWPIEQARAGQAQLTELAAAEGLEFRLDLARSGNTFDGHRLVHLAATQGAGDAMTERLLRSYFTDGRLISDRDTLLAAGADVGLPEDDVRGLLAGELYADEVRVDEHMAAGLGLRGVPAFIVDRSLGVTGAQHPDVLRELLRQGWARREQAAVA